MRIAIGVAVGFGVGLGVGFGVGLGVGVGVGVGLGLGLAVGEGVGEGVAVGLAVGAAGEGVADTAATEVDELRIDPDHGPQTASEATSKAVSRIAPTITSPTTRRRRPNNISQPPLAGSTAAEP
jgi:hypothetical protein